MTSTWPVFLVSNSQNPLPLPPPPTASPSDIVWQLIQADACEHMVFSYVFSILLFLRLQFWVRAAFVCSQHLEWENLEAALSGLNISFKCFTWLGVVTLSWNPSTFWAEDWEFNASLGIHSETLSRGEGGRKEGRAHPSVSNEKSKLMSWLLACLQAAFLLVPENSFFFEATMMSLHASYSYNHCVLSSEFFQQPIIVKSYTSHCINSICWFLCQQYLLVSILRDGAREQVSEKGAWHSIPDDSCQLVLCC